MQASGQVNGVLSFDCAQDDTVWCRNDIMRADNIDYTKRGCLVQPLFIIEHNI